MEKLLYFGLALGAIAFVMMYVGVRFFGSVSSEEVDFVDNKKRNKNLFLLYYLGMIIVPISLTSIGLYFQSIEAWGWFWVFVLLPHASTYVMPYMFALLTMSVYTLALLPYDAMISKIFRLHRLVTVPTAWFSFVVSLVLAIVYWTTSLEGETLSYLLIVIFVVYCGVHVGYRIHNILKELNRKKRLKEKKQQAEQRAREEEHEKEYTARKEEERRKIIEQITQKMQQGIFVKGSDYSYIFPTHVWMSYFENVQFDDIIVYSALRNAAAWNNDHIYNIIHDVHNLYKRTYDDNKIMIIIEFIKNFDAYVKKMGYGSLEQFYTNHLEGYNYDYVREFLKVSYSTKKLLLN